MSGANQYLLRAPFSLEKITWVERTKRVVYRSSRSWRTKRNFQVFTATEFLAAAVEHIPPKNRHTIRYYGRYSNKCRGREVEAWEGDIDRDRPETVPPPPAETARALRPLWRDLIIRIWGDPLICPCCKGLMRVAGTLTRPEEIEKRRRLVGVLDGGAAEARRVSPRAERANQTMDPIRVPALFRWAQEDESETIDASEVPWQAPELPLDEERILVLDGDPGPPDDFLGF